MPIAATQGKFKSASSGPMPFRAVDANASQSRVQLTLRKCLVILEIAIVATNAAWRSVRTPGLLSIESGSQSVPKARGARDGAMWGCTVTVSSQRLADGFSPHSCLAVMLAAAALTIGCDFEPAQAPCRASRARQGNLAAPATPTFLRSRRTDDDSSCSAIRPAAANFARRHSRPTPDDRRTRRATTSCAAM